MRFVFLSFFTLNYFWGAGEAVEMAAAAMVFCISCGNKLAGRYCGQCGGDSQSTADAQSQVPVLTTVMIPGPDKQGKGHCSSPP